MPHRYYRNLKIEPQPSVEVKRQYSVTSDILSYRRCPIQYYIFSLKKYQPALTLQLYFGTIVHRVLDCLHLQYKGLLGDGLACQVPSDVDVENYFQQVQNILRAHRIWAPSAQRDYVREVLKRFNRLEGPSLYPRVIDTECRLQAARENYILHGTVDVLAASENDPDEVEMWDYKAGRKPSIRDPVYQQYEFQMQVYAGLYQRLKGQTPRRGVLYFLSELGGPTEPRERPKNAIIEIDFREETIEQAIRFFDETVTEIEQCRNSGRLDPGPFSPPKETCDACDLRWNCRVARSLNRKYPYRYP